MPILQLYKVKENVFRFKKLGVVQMILYTGILSHEWHISFWTGLSQKEIGHQGGFLNGREHLGLFLNNYLNSDNYSPFSDSDRK